MLENFKPYEKKNWKNAPDKGTPLSADNLDYMDSGIKENSDAIKEIKESISEKIENDSSKIPNMRVAYQLQEKILSMGKAIPNELEISGTISYNTSCKINGIQNINCLFSPSIIVSYNEIIEIGKVPENPKNDEYFIGYVSNTDSDDDAYYPIYMVITADGKIIVKLPREEIGIEEGEETESLQFYINTIYLL